MKKRSKHPVSVKVSRAKAIESELQGLAGAVRTLDQLLGAVIEAVGVEKVRDVLRAHGEKAANGGT